MGADTAPLPDSVTKGFGVMSTRPEHGDFDEVPAHPVRISKAFKISITEVSPAEYRLFDPSYKTGEATPAYAAGVSWHAGNGLLRVADQEDRQAMASAHRS